MGERIYREVKVVMYRGISYNRYICVSIIYIRVTVGDMLHIGYISVRSRGIEQHCVQMGGTPQAVHMRHAWAVHSVCRWEHYRGAVLGSGRCSRRPLWCLCLCPCRVEGL